MNGKVFSDIKEGKRHVLKQDPNDMIVAESGNRMATHDLADVKLTRSVNGEWITSDLISQLAVDGMVPSKQNRRH